MENCAERKPRKSARARVRACVSMGVKRTAWLICRIPNGVPLCSKYSALETNALRHRAIDKGDAADAAAGEAYTSTCGRPLRASLGTAVGGVSRHPREPHANFPALRIQCECSANGGARSDAACGWRIRDNEQSGERERCGTGGVDMKGLRLIYRIKSGVHSVCWEMKALQVGS